jgi:hypothetical protein
MRWIGDSTLDVELARRACDLVSEHATRDECRAAAMLARIKVDHSLRTLVLQGSRVELTPEVVDALAQVQRSFPGTHAAREAESIRTRMQMLSSGSAAPELDVADTEGKPMRLADERGKVVVVHFWGFW